ncbi:pentapeptide repeat-containing protein, partial [Nostoc sp. UIC 10630]|uniref:pentapeptide repeat-containing protein n=2 Tax=unclassified Nostoc TaxID=2593658 RepID=UPI0013D1E5B7|nr:pentapeptide repeat-containing protein [Nostoc sp. UIC 10630]
MLQSVQADNQNKFKVNPAFRNVVMLLDYSHKNLTGRSFKGKNLVGANFSFADIRSCDFSGAILKDANFYHAKAGIQNLWVIYLPVCSLLFLGILGFFSYIANYLVTLIAQSSNLDNLITGVSTSILLVIFFLTTFCQGLETGVPLFIVIGTITVLFLTGIKSTAAFNGASAGVLIIAITLVGSIALSAAIAAFNRTVAVMISILVMLCLTAAVT